jgi:YidC/Oxa1 family membrane protein insertase
VDQRRFIAFLALTMAVLLLSGKLFPPPPEPVKPKPAAGVPNADAVADAAKDQAKGAADHAADGTEAAAAAAVPAIAAINVAADAVPQQFVSLGSLDVESGYRMLITLTNEGASVERIELSSPRFHDLQDRSGYLGQMALVPVDGGLKVSVVGAGTPAAAAGLVVGDVISGVTLPKASAKDVKTVDEFHAAMADSKPGEEITLDVKHGNDAAKPITVKLGERPLEVIRPESENIRIRGAKPPADFVNRPSFLMSLAGIAGKPLTADAAAQVAKLLEGGHWEVAKHDESSVTFERAIPDMNFKLIKRYTLTPAPAGSRSDENFPAYGFQLDVELENTGDAPQTFAYRLDGPNGLPVEGWWYAHKISQRWFSAAGLRDVAVRFNKSAELQIDCATIADGKVEPMGGEGTSLAYAGVDGLYFASIMVPVKESLDEDWFDSTEAILVGPKPDARTSKTYSNVSCRLTRKPIELAAGKSQRDSYQVFVGPKYPNLLAQYKAANDPNYSLKDIIYYGMTPFGDVARGMLVVLNFFHSIVGNFGLAIIMLTVCVRGMIFPISYKQTRNMARMQALKPELDRITEKYKNDMPKRSEAMQELYRKNKINPLGGCLPLFLQLPIFIGLYRSIMVDAELRQAPLFGHWTRWCSDLTAPDMLWNWSHIMPDFVNSGVGLFGLGPYLNVLPFITVSLFFVAQKLSMPPPTNEQAAMQQRMMKYMNVFILLLFYRSASGLCLYFIASSLWGIGERKLLARNQANTSLAVATLPAASRNGNSGGGRSQKSKQKK